MCAKELRLRRRLEEKGGRVRLVVGKSVVSSLWIVRPVRGTRNLNQQNNSKVGG